MEICDTPDECAKEVQSRFIQHVEFVLQSEDVMGEFIAIQKDVDIFSQKINEQLNDMENELASKRMNALASTGATLGMLYVFLHDFAIAMSLQTLPVVLPILAVASLVCYFAAFTLNFIWKWNRRDEKLKAIDTVYEKCSLSVRTIVSEQLNKNVATLLTKLIDKVTVDKLPRQIEAIEVMIQQLVTSRKKIIANRGLLLDLASKMDKMQKNICEMQRNLLTIYLPTQEQTSSESAT